MECPHCGFTNLVNRRTCEACGKLARSRRTPDTMSLHYLSGRTPKAGTPGDDLDDQQYERENAQGAILPRGCRVPRKKKRTG